MVQKVYKKTILLLGIIMDSMACWSCECSRCIAARASTEWTPNSCLLYVGTSLCFSGYRTGINMKITDNWMSVHTMLPNEAAFCWNTWSFFFPLPSPTKPQKTPQTLVTMNEPRMSLNEWSWHMSHEQVDDFDQPMLAWIKTLRESCNIRWYLMWYDVVDVLAGSIWAMCDAYDAFQ